MRIDGVRFYGSPWTPVFMHWDFMLGPREIAEKWALIPDDTDVLITHGPPIGCLDHVPGNGHQGCAELMRRLREVRPRYSLFGHIHEEGGRLLHSPDGLDGTVLVNASVLDESYRLVSGPVVLEL